MDIVEFKLLQYRTSKNKNIPFEFMTLDGRNIEDIITGNENIQELVDKSKKYRTINNTSFNMNTIMFIYIKNGNIEKEEADQAINEMNFYYSVDKSVIDTNLTSFKVLAYQPYTRELDDRIRDLYNCENFLPKTPEKIKVYDTRIIDMKVELLFENYLTSLDFFRQVETSKNLSHVSLYNEKQSLCKVYTANGDQVSGPCWFEKSEKDCFNHESETLVKRDDNVRAMYQYIPQGSFGSRLKLNPSKVKFYSKTKKLYTWIPQSFTFEKDLFIKHLLLHFKSLENVKVSDDSVRSMFIVNWTFDRHLFLDFIFTNPELESIMYMDESQIFTIKKSFNLNLVFHNSDTRKIQVSINQRDPEQDGKVEKYTFGGNTEYISFPHTQFIIKNTKTIEETEMVKKLVIKLITLYETKKDEIQEWYTLMGIPEKKVVAKKVSAVKTLSNHKRNKMIDEDINRPGIARKVQGDSQSKIIAEEVIGDKQSHEKAMEIVSKYKKLGIPVIRFPTVIRGNDDYNNLNRTKYYYQIGVSSLKDDTTKTKHIYPGIVPYEEHKKYPFLLIFYKKPLNVKDMNIKLEDGDVVGNNIIIHKDWSITIVKPSHRSPKSAMSILLNQRVFFSPYNVSLSSFSKEDEKNELYSKNSILFALMGVFGLKNAKQTLKDMIDKTNPVILKQQFWNSSIIDIKHEMARLLTGDGHLNTKFFVRMIEDYFDINLFTFYFDVHNFYLEIPEYRHVYVYEKRDRPTFCALFTELTPGIPYYKLILLDRNPSVPDDIRQKLFNLRDSIVNYKCEPIVIDTRMKMTGQILDVFGKTRVIEYENKVQIETPRPMEPFNLPEVETITPTIKFDNDKFKVHRPQSTSDYLDRKRVAKFIKEYAKLCQLFTNNLPDNVIIEKPNYIGAYKSFDPTVPFFLDFEEMNNYFTEKYPLMFKSGRLIIESDQVLKGLMSYVQTFKYASQPQTLLELCNEPSDFKAYNPFEIILTQDVAIRNLKISNTINVYKQHKQTDDPYLFRDGSGRLFLCQNVMYNDKSVANRILQQWNMFKVNTGYYSLPLSGKVDLFLYEDGVSLPSQPGIAKYKEDIFFFAPFS